MSMSISQSYEATELKYKMKLVHEQLTRRDDPFYSAAMRCIEINNEKEENGGWQKENRRRLAILKQIINNYIEETNATYILPETTVKCSHELVSQFTGRSVTEENSKKFGCSVTIDYNFVSDCEATIHIFDGVYYYEYEMIANIPLIVSKLRKEIVTECLYETSLVCRDVARLITSFVC